MSDWQPTDDDDDPTFQDWVPEFTVWIVRRGSTYPMAIDSIFMDEPTAKTRAALLGGKWFAGPYRHLKPPSLPDPPKGSA